MNKGQIMGQALIFVLGAIIFGMILLFGYRSISILQDKQNEICLIGMQSTLKTNVEKITASYGTVRRLDLSVCPGFTTLCFVEHGKISRATKYYTDGTEYTTYDLLYHKSALMANSVLSGESGQNVFLKPWDKAKMPITVGKIEVANETGFMCFDNMQGSTVSLRLEGKGDHTSISRWQE